MRLSFIGTGNVAGHLMNAFHNAQHEIVEIVSKDPQNANHYAQLYHAKSIAEPNQLSDQVDFIFICVNDFNIESIAKDLANHQTCIVHTAGSVNVEVLNSTHHTSAVIYPLQTFSKNKQIEYSKIPFFVECVDANIRIKIKQLLDSIHANMHMADSKQRMSLHIAAVFACNFTNHMYAIAAEILKENQLDFKVLSSLIQETVDKVQILDPHDAQTGPAKRNDLNTLSKHLEFLKSHESYFSVYQLLSEQIKEKHNQ
jgi:predicted short-subunit dehydrogenase-like oxidoreductase (DUF2520 family)